MTTDGHSNARCELRADEGAAAFRRPERPCERSRGPAVAVLLDQSVEDVTAHDAPVRRSLDGILDLGRNLLRDPLMRPAPIEVGNELAEDPAEVALADHDEVVESLATDGPDEPFRDRVLEGRARDADLGPGAFRDLVEDLPVIAVTVAEEKARRILPAPGENVLELLCRPLARRVIREVPVEDLARPELHEEEDEDLAVKPGRDGEEVAGPRDADLVSEERRPRLPTRTPRPLLAEDLLHGPLMDSDRELGEELANDPLRAPVGLARPLADQLDRLGCEPPAPRLLSLPLGEAGPELAEPFVRPADERLGPHDDEELAPPRHEHAQERQKESVRGVEPRPLALSLVGLELCADEGVLANERGVVAREIAKHSAEDVRELVHGPIPELSLPGEPLFRQALRRSPKA